MKYTYYVSFIIPEKNSYGNVEVYSKKKWTTIEQIREAEKSIKEVHHLSEVVILNYILLKK
jgi:hypothetical protein